MAWTVQSPRRSRSSSPAMGRARVADGVVDDQQAGNAYHAHIPVGNPVNNLAPIEWLQTKHWFQGTQYLIEFPAYQHA